MFARSARFYDHFYGFKNYDAAAEKLHRTIQAMNRGANTLLDVGCGTGKHLEWLQRHYAVEGLDLNVKLLELAASRCPNIVFHERDMTDFHLGRRFDVVTCLFSAIGYVKTRDAMFSTLRCMASHLNEGGLAIVEPWFTPEQYWVGRLTANYVDEPDLKIAWMYISERRGEVSVLDIHYMVGTPAGIEEFTERHELGLFSQSEYEKAFIAAGLEVGFDPEGLFQRGLYVGRLPFA